MFIIIKIINDDSYVEKHKSTHKYALCDLYICIAYIMHKNIFLYYTS